MALFGGQFGLAPGVIAGQPVAEFTALADDAFGPLVEPDAAPLAAEGGKWAECRSDKLRAATAAVCPALGYRHAAPVVRSDKAKKTFAPNEGS